MGYYPIVKLKMVLRQPERTDFRNDGTIISSISVTDIVFDIYLEKWNYRTIPKTKTWSYFLTIP